MNKLEVGMYVRTKEGNIEKICAIENEHIYTDEDYLSWYPSSNAISKASHNIIDLIEVGDYVNGEKVIRIYEKGECYDGSNYGLITKTIETENDNYETIPHDHLYVGYSIKSIVTKEQFESMEYRLGE